MNEVQRTYPMRLAAKRAPYGEAPVLFDYDVTVSVDLDAIARSLGGRAARNKSGKSSVLKGLVTVFAKRRPE